MDVSLCCDMYLIVKNILDWGSRVLGSWPGSSLWTPSLCWATSCLCNTLIWLYVTDCRLASRWTRSELRAGLLIQPHPVRVVHTHTPAPVCRPCVHEGWQSQLSCFFPSSTDVGNSGWWSALCLCVALVQWWGLGCLSERLFSQLVYQASNGQWMELVLSATAEIAFPPWQLPSPCQQLPVVDDSLISFCFWEKKEDAVKSCICRSKFHLALTAKCLFNFNSSSMSWTVWVSLTCWPLWVVSHLCVWNTKQDVKPKL